MVENKGAKNGARGELAVLAELARKVPPTAVPMVLEIIQRECESEAKAHENLLARGNNLLAASGVALGLLLGVIKDLKEHTQPQKTLLILALISSTVTGLLVLIGGRLVVSEVSMRDTIIAGKQVSERADENAWKRDYGLSLFLSYSEIRGNIASRHRKRGALLVWAQRSYLAFVVFVSGLGLSLVW